MQKNQYFFKFLDATNQDGTVYYKIQINIPGDDQQTILFRSRYSQLRQIHDKCLKYVNKSQLPDFPQKKLFGSTNRDFIQKRKKQLEHYYNTLGQTIQIKKLSDLYRFIEGQRKKKTNNNTTKQGDQQNKVQVKPKKEDQLKNAFQNIYTDVISKLTNMTDDFYPQEQSNKHFKYVSQLGNFKPIKSELTKTLSIKGKQQNDGDYWSIFFIDDNQDLLNKVNNIVKQINTFQEQIINNRSHSIAIAQ